MSAENSGKPLGSRGSTRTPLGELTCSALLDPVAGGRGLLPPPQEPYPRCRPWVLHFADQPPSASPLPWTVPTGAENAFIYLTVSAGPSDFLFLGADYK